MKMVQFYSHLNGIEFLIVHKKYILREIEDIIHGVDAYARDWQELRTYYYVNEDLQTTRDTVHISDKKIQRNAIERRGFTAYKTYNQVDFVKDRVAVEVQLGKYFAVQYDLHVTNIVREGRSNPSVPIVLMGIEP